MTRLTLLLLLGLAAACGGPATETAAGLPATASPQASPALMTALTPTPLREATPETMATPTGARNLPESPGVRVGSAAFEVEPAVTGAQRTQGLSGRPALRPGAGMLFIFERESRYTFWMIDMRFPLDLVWIGAGCAVVDVTLNAPPPAAGQTPEELPRYAPAVPARYVLEINAGEAQRAGIGPGDPVVFTGTLAGRYGC